MRLSFRQGLARYQTNISSSPTFLQWSAGAGDFVDLIVSPDPTIVVFAHRGANYVFEEIKTVPRAWGPISGSSTVQLYWDVNMLTGVLTRGVTMLPPMYTSSEPVSPGTDQHWFDIANSTMKVWNGTKWQEKIRVFAGFVTSGAIIRPSPIGSQVGISEECEAGNLVLDAYNKPLRQSDGTFVTSVSSLIIVNGAGKKVKFEAEVLAGMAEEPVPKFSLVQMRAGRRIVLARHTDPMSRIAGIVLEDLYTNEPGSIVTEGLIRNESWNFPKALVNRPVFCGANGEVTTNPPKVGVIQASGFVYDTDAIYMNIFQPIILDDVSNIQVQPEIPPLPNSVTANFYAATTAGTAPLAVNFTNVSTGNPTSYEWDFTNDGTVDATTPSPSYTYPAPGKYTVKLRAKNAVSFDDEVKTDYINVQVPPQEVGAFTNLGITLGGPSQVSQGQIFQISVTISNDGRRAASKVTRVLVIPDIKGEAVQVTGLPASASVQHVSDRTIVSMPEVLALPSGSTYGPMIISIKAPGRFGTMLISGTVQSPEIDSTLGDNTTSISIEVKQ